MKRMRLLAGLLGVSMLLVACNSAEKDVLAASEKVEEQEGIVIEQINEIASEEGKLQEQFKETLADDKELKSMEDASSIVFENIDNRNASLELIQKATGELSTQAEEMKDIDAKDLPEKEFEDFHSSLETTTSSLNDWVEIYEQNLTEEENYFKSLSSDEVTYETFMEGIEEINKQHKQSNDQLHTLDGQLSELSSSRTTIVKQLEDQKK